jgi:hypothetical protein
VRERLYQAFVEHSVLVVRDQNLDAPQFLARSATTAFPTCCCRREDRRRFAQQPRL